MKNILTILLIFISITSFGQGKPAYKIFDKQGNEVDYIKMLGTMLQNDIVLFGETHNNPISHWLELNIAEDLYKNKKENFVIGAEMFESDNQLIIDEYFSDIINEKSFEEECRLWDNYKTDYKPIVNFAKSNKIKLIATNIPRRYANLVYRNDFQALNSLSKDAKKYIAPLPIKYDSTLECYKSMIDNMQGMPGHGNGSTIAKAQAIKDATMAYLIVQNLKKGKLFYHFNGSYHSDNFQGIYWYIKQLNAGLKVVTVTTVSQDDITFLLPENDNLADFIICVPSDMTTTY